MLIFTFVWFLSYFLSHQISPKTLKDFSPLNVIGIKFSIVIYLVLKAYDYCPLIYPFVISSYAMHHVFTHPCHNSRRLIKILVTTKILPINWHFLFKGVFFIFILSSFQNLVPSWIETFFSWKITKLCGLYCFFCFAKHIPWPKTEE